MRLSVEIEVVVDPARACAAMLVGAAADGGHVVLSGGSTPRAAYERFVESVTAGRLDLEPATFWFGDERCVGPDDDRSNYLMVKQSLLDPLGADNQPQVRRMKGELGPDGGAEDYERQLRDGHPGEFDLLLLGIGPDGHIASMFPDQSSLDERARFVVGVEQAGLEPFVPRITMTLPAIATARQVVLLASGASKADAVASAFGSGAKPNHHVPASMLPPVAKQVTVLLDAAAAARL